jgi:hypothetical protein
MADRILAIEAEAYRQGWDANTATSFGNRAASQDALLREWVEHHQPEGYEGIQDCSDINDRTEAYLARAASQLLSQERPSIDVELLASVIEGMPLDPMVTLAVRIAGRYNEAARLAGWSGEGEAPSPVHSDD